MEYIRLSYTRETYISRPGVGVFLRNNTSTKMFNCVFNVESQFKLRKSQLYQIIKLFL